MGFHSKFDYLQLGERKNVNYSIRKDLDLELKIYSKIIGQSCSKILDVLLQEAMKNEQTKSNLKQLVENYR